MKNAMASKKYAPHADMAALESCACGAKPAAIKTVKAAPAKIATKEAPAKKVAKKKVSAKRR